MTTRKSLQLILFLLCSVRIVCSADLRQEFAEPPLKYATRPLWFWNNTTVTEEGIESQMQQAHDKCGYGGFGILPFGERFTPKYLTEDYFKVYGAALRKAKELGMTMCIYDEYGFPSGSAGAIHGDGIPRFANKHPEHTIKRLDKHEQDLTGPGKFAATIPEGRLMSLIAMEMTTKKRVDLTGMVHNGKITWPIPKGTWKVMTFVCVKDGSRNTQGGRAVFLKNPTAKTLQHTLDSMLEVYDVEFEEGKALRYIHKIKDGRHIFFLANLGQRPIHTWVELRGTLEPELWNPHTGDISKPDYSHEKRGLSKVTKMKIELPPIRSIFILAKQDK